MTDELTFNTLAAEVVALQAELAAIRGPKCAWCKADYTIIDDDFGQPVHPNMVKFCFNCGRKLI